MSGGGMSGGGMSGGGMSHTQHHSPSLLQYTVEARPIPSPPPLIPGHVSSHQARYSKGLNCNII